MPPWTSDTGATWAGPAPWVRPELNVALASTVPHILLHDTACTMLLLHLNRNASFQTLPPLPQWLIETCRGTERRAASSAGARGRHSSQFAQSATAPLRRDPNLRGLALEAW